MTNSKKDKSAKRQMQIDKLQNDKRQNVKYSKKTKIINEANFESFFKKHTCDSNYFLGTPKL